MRAVYFVGTGVPQLANSSLRISIMVSRFCQNLAGSSCAVFVFMSALVPAQAEEVAVYRLDSFDKGALTGSGGRPEARVGFTVEKKIVHGGSQAARITWNLTQSQDPVNNFLNFDFHRPILGTPESIDVWAYPDKAAIGTSLRLVVLDTNREIYVCDAPITQEGWQQLKFPLAKFVAPFASGDKNQKIDFPITTLAFRVESGDAGSMVLDDVTVQTRGTAEELVVADVIPQESFGVGWGSAPQFTLDLSNNSSVELNDLQLVLEARDEIADRLVWSDKVPVASLPAKEASQFSIAPTIPNGAFVLKWRLEGGGKSYPGGAGALRIARMAGDVSIEATTDAEREYVRRYGILGGVFWSCPPERAAKTGAAWRRQGENWHQIEVKPGEFDFKQAIAEAKETRDAGLDFIYFQTVYTHPKFYETEHINFAGAFGRMFRELSKTFGPLVRDYELGNEDNGPTKFLYTEIARNGAAGIRAESATNLIFNSGTASVDIPWLRSQATRRLFDRLDGLVVHPYTGTASPETFNVLAQCGELDALIDKIGGMKLMLSTEFGYPHEFDQLKRAQWIPRSVVVGEAGGLWKHGLYAWDNHFGIYDNGSAFPSAVSLNAFCRFTYGHRFVGWYQKDESIWAAAYERAGTPLLIAWSPTDKGNLKLDTIEGVEAYDLFGNSIKVENPMSLTESPIYFKKMPESVLAAAQKERSVRETKRFARNLNASSLAHQPAWQHLEGATQPSYADLAKVLLSWNPSADTVSLEDQSTIAQAVRRLILAAQAEGSVSGASISASKPVAPAKWDKLLTDSVQADVDIPSLRWLLTTWEQNRMQAAMCKTAGNDAYAASLTRLDEVYAHLCDVFANKGGRVFFPIWPYLYKGVTDDGAVQERLSLVEGKAVPVKVRLRSYGKTPYDTEVSLNLPDSWTCEPKSWKGQVGADKAKEIIFQVTASDVIPTGIEAWLQVEGKPKVVTVFNDFEVLPALQMSTPVLSKLLPAGPLSIQVSNNSTKEIGAKIAASDKSIADAQAVGATGALGPGSAKTLELQLPTDTKQPDFNEWLFEVEAKTTEGKTVKVNLVPDFDIAVEAKTAPVIDGNLDDWKDAAPLHLDREEYTHGTFAGSWSKDDLSGVVFTKWDDKYFYVAAKVTDQLFNQTQFDGDAWNEDSIQIAIGTKETGLYEFSLALTMKGPQVWGFSNSHGLGAMADAKVNVIHSSGLIVYEAAIPWSALGNIKPAAGKTLKFDVLFNDNDAIVSRRVMERYGIGIVHTKKLDDLGNLSLH